MAKLTQIIRNLLQDETLSIKERNAEVKNLLEMADNKQIDTDIEDDRAPRMPGNDGKLSALEVQGHTVIPSLIKGFGKSIAKTATGLFNSPEVNKELEASNGAETIGGIGADIATTAALPMLGAAKKLSTGAKVLNTGLNMAGQSGGLSALKGNDTGTVATDTALGGVLGSTMHGVPELLKAGSGKYIKGALKGTEVTDFPRLLERALERVLDTKPKLNKTIPFASDNELKSFTDLVNDSEGLFNSATRKEIGVASEVDRVVSKKGIERIIKEGTEGAEFPSAVNGKIGNTNVTELDPTNFTPRYEQGGKNLVDTLTKYFSRTNPQPVTQADKLAGFRMAKDVQVAANMKQAESVIPDLEQTTELLKVYPRNPGETMSKWMQRVTDEIKMPKQAITSKQQGSGFDLMNKLENGTEFAPPLKAESIKPRYVDPVTGKRISAEGANPNAMNLEDLLDFTRELEYSKPHTLAESTNPLFTPRSDPNKNAVNRLAAVLTDSSSDLANAMRNTDDEVLIARMIQKLGLGSKSPDNFVPLGRSVSGVTHNNLPYAGAAALTSTKPLTAARNVSKSSDDFKRTVLPRLLKLIPAFSQQ